MEDYEKLANLQRSMTTEQAGMDRDIKDLKAKYASNEFCWNYLIYCTNKYNQTSKYENV